MILCRTATAPIGAKRLPVQPVDIPRDLITLVFDLHAAGDGPLGDRWVGADQMHILKDRFDDLPHHVGDFRDLALRGVEPDLLE